MKKVQVQTICQLPDLAQTIETNVMIQELQEGMLIHGRLEDILIQLYKMFYILLYQVAQVWVFVTSKTHVET